MSLPANLNNFKSKKFGRLTAIQFSHMSKNSMQYWVFKCDCGNEVVRERCSVVRGSQLSCGCLAIEVTKKRSTTHGQAKSKNNSASSTYTTWSSIIQRCNNEKDKRYYNTEIFHEWLIFENFYRDMGERPAGKTIDRIDNTKGYHPDNTRWATKSEQSRNTRRFKNKKNNIKYRGVSFREDRRNFVTLIKVNSKVIYIGSFKTELEAAKAYNEAAIKYHGEFAQLNELTP